LVPYSTDPPQKKIIITYLLFSSLKCTDNLNKSLKLMDSKKKRERESLGAGSTIEEAISRK